MNVVIKNIEFEQIEVIGGQVLNGASYVHFNCWSDGLNIDGKIKIESGVFQEAFVNELKENIRNAVSKSVSQ